LFFLSIIFTVVISRWVLKTQKIWLVGIVAVFVHKQ
jgi:hypothetical protein